MSEEPRIVRPPGIPRLDAARRSAADEGAANESKPRAASSRIAPPSFIEEIERPGPPPSMEEGPRSSRALTIFVAVFALLAFGGVVWYAYDQGRRVGGEAAAPLIKADPTPTKIRPEEPGGLEVPNRDKLVFDRLPGASRDTERVERLLPPPETPVVPPAPAPAPATEAPASPPPVSVAGVVASELSETPAPQVPSASGSGEESSIAVAPPPAPSVAPSPAAIPPARVEAPPVQPAPSAPTAPVAVAPAETAPAVAAPAPAPARVTSPSVPSVQAARPQAAPEPAPAPAPAPVAQTPAVTGPFNIQIAALRDRASAEAEWARVVRRFPTELSDLTLTIKQVDLGDRGVFHRVQGGSLPEVRARAICAALDAGGQPCLVVRR